MAGYRILIPSSWVTACTLLCPKLSRSGLHVDSTWGQGNLIGESATYTRNQWTALLRYIEYGDISFDNNFAERAMCPIAIGRKNWLLVGSELAGHRAAILTSLVAS